MEVSHHVVLHESQTEAQAVAGGGFGRVESLEEVGQDLGRDTVAPIHHLDIQTVVALRERYADQPMLIAAGRVVRLDGVDDKITNDVLELYRVAAQPTIGHRADIEPHAGLAGQRVENPPQLV